jgi:hypothetical protein
MRNKLNFTLDRQPGSRVIINLPRVLRGIHFRRSCQQTGEEVKEHRIGVWARDAAACVMVGTRSRASGVARLRGIVTAYRRLATSCGPRHGLEGIRNMECLRDPRGHTGGAKRIGVSFGNNPAREPN